MTRQSHLELAPVLRSLISNKSVVFDIGSHAGQFTKLFARLSPDGMVYAFEPSSYARSILSISLSPHRMKNVQVVPAAVGDTPGTLPLTSPVKPRGSVRFGLAHLGGNSTVRGHTESVPVLTLDEFSDEYRVHDLDFLKADIEGWEMRALLGGKNTIKRHRPTMYLELINSHLARAGDSLHEAWELLLSWDYRPLEWTSGTKLQLLETPRDGDAFWIPSEHNVTLKST